MQKRNNNIKGLPEYSIEGGLCNAKDCTNVCTILCAQDDIWYCEKHAKERVEEFLGMFTTIGYGI